MKFVKSKTLTYEQARELDWFCKNVTGTRQEFYAVMEKADAFDEKIKRLEQTAGLITQLFGEEIEAYYKRFEEPQAVPDESGSGS